MANIINQYGQVKLGVRYTSTPLTSTLWGNLYSVYNADSVGSSSLKTSLVSAYNGESNTNDSFGTNNGTAVGGLTYTTGKIGNAFQFNGTNAYVSLPNSSGQFNFDGDFSVSMWFKSSNLSTSRYAIGNYKSGGSNGYGWQLYYSQTGGFAFDLRNGNNINQVRKIQTINTNTWYHVVAVRKMGQIHKLYVNGVDQSAPQTDGNINNVAGYTANQPMNLGGLSDANAPALCDLDGVNMWQKELTSAEVTELYNSGNGAQYITDSFYKPTTNDALNTYNGTAQGGLTYGVGKVGTAFQFNGSNAYVSLPNNSLNLTGDFTISAWVYPTAGTPQSILDNLAYAGGTVYKGWQLDINNVSGAQSYKVTFTIGQGPGGSNYTGWEYSTTALTPNAWNHILIKRVSGVNTYCWVNNISQSYVLYGTGKDITLNPTYHTTQYNTIGSFKQLSGTVSNYLANGSKVDGVTVWNRALTDDERTQIYNSGNGKQYPN